LTPLRVVGDAVTFRLRWLRLAALQQQLDQIRLDSSKALRAPNEDIELTLRPGESWPVDTVQMPPGSKNSNGRPCGRIASIRASVEAYPWVDEEERLVVADLWLVERLPNGSEVQRSQALSVRGLPNRPFAFYFDRIVESGVPLDIYGRLLAHLESGGLAVSLDTRCRWGDPSPSRRYFGAQKSLKSELNLKPEEIVEVRLPLLGDEARPFAKREFSIRIRGRQLR